MAGVYTIVEEGGRGTYLAYKLEVPESPGAVQQELRIFPQARFHLSIKVSIPGEHSRLAITLIYSESFRGGVGAGQLWND